jgi:hypothetical protein
MLQVNPMLRARLIAELARKKISFDPEMYEEEGDWNFVDIPEGDFDINFWFPDYNKFAVTAYYTTKNDIGDAITDRSKFFRLFEKQIWLNIED